MEPCRELTIGGRYRLHEEIGRGGVGVVWRAHSIALDIPCAIKFLLPQHAKDAGQRARFIHEARAAAALRSAHTVLVFDVDEWEGRPFIAMELLNGESLEQCLQRRGSLSSQFTCEVVRQIALGLSKAHATGLVHRDLKPDNVFLVEDEATLVVKILDFGIAKRTQAALDFRTVTGTLIGTPYYMSPEQSKGSKDVDFRSDLWSLAVLAYRCLTGRLPFEGESLTEILLKIVHGPLPSLGDANPGLPKAAEAWWRNAADRDPARRPGSAMELSKGLARALFGAQGAPSGIPEYMLSGTRARPSLPDAGGTTQRSAGRRWWWRAAAVGATLVLGASGYWLLRSTAVGEGRGEAGMEHRVLPSRARPSARGVEGQRDEQLPAQIVAAAPPSAPPAAPEPGPGAAAASTPLAVEATAEPARSTPTPVPGAATSPGIEAATPRAAAPPVRAAVDRVLPGPRVAPPPAANRRAAVTQPPIVTQPPVVKPKAQPATGLDDRLGF